MQFADGFTSGIDKCTGFLGEGHGHRHCRTTARRSGWLVEPEVWCFGAGEVDAIGVPFRLLCAAAVSVGLLCQTLVRRRVFWCIR